MSAGVEPLDVRRLGCAEGDGELVAVEGGAVDGDGDGVGVLQAVGRVDHLVVAGVNLAERSGAFLPSVMAVGAVLRCQVHLVVAAIEGHRHPGRRTRQCRVPRSPVTGWQLLQVVAGEVGVGQHDVQLAFVAGRRSWPWTADRGTPWRATCARRSSATCCRRTGLPAPASTRLRRRGTQPPAPDRRPSSCHSKWPPSPLSRWQALQV